MGDSDTNVAFELKCNIRCSLCLFYKLIHQTNRGAIYIRRKRLVTYHARDRYSGNA